METVPEQKVPWAGFRYEPVRGLVDRKISRFLRTQRKNMRRLFQERGMLDLAAQLDELRRQPNRNFMQKNKSFQRILNEHIARSAPVTEAPHSEGEGSGRLDVPPMGNSVAVPVADLRPDTGEGVPEVAAADVNGFVIEE